MIKTKCVYDPKEPEDGLRVLVTRKWPRGVKKSHVDVWWPQLGPSVELLADWRQGKITWEEYEKRFRDEMSATAARVLWRGISVVEILERITLLCVENENNPHCHRLPLKRLIEGG